MMKHTTLYQVPFEKSQPESLTELQQRCAAANKLLAVAPYFSYAVRKDGTVLVTKAIRPCSFDCGQAEVDSWRNIIAIAASIHHTVGIKQNGTVVATGYNGHNECNVSSWKQIVAIATGNAHTVGLKSDGTVVATGSNHNCECLVDEWTDIIAIAAGRHHTVGLKTDGTVVTTRFEDDLSTWSNIVAICASGYTTIGLQADGTVIRKTITYEERFSGEGIIGIGGESYGINKDGSVIELHYNKKMNQISNVIAISANENHILGLQANGSLISTKYVGNSSYYFGQDRVSGWKIY